MAMHSVMPISGADNMRRVRASQAGFTLVEVLIALAILSIALAAAMRAASMATVSAEEAKLRTYATWVAQNRAAELSARRVFPSVGIENGAAQMGGITFQWLATSNETPNTAFRKTEIAVTRDAASSDQRTLAKLTVYLARAADSPAGVAP